MGFYYGVKLQLITDIDGLPLDLQFTTTKLGDRDWLESRAITIDLLHNPAQILYNL
jgi:hypothetical protein